MTWPEGRSDAKSGEKIDCRDHLELSPAAQKMIHDGDLPCTSIQKIVEQGRNALQQAVKAAQQRADDESNSTAGSAASPRTILIQLT